MAVDKEKLEEKIGQAIGLEMAAQKAVEELSSKGLLPNERSLRDKLERMRKQAGNHQTGMDALVSILTKSDGLDSSKVQQVAEETEQKAEKIMEVYLGEDPDTQEALEFLCLAEAGEVTHYEVLNAMTREHLLLCTQLAKKNAFSFLKLFLTILRSFICLKHYLFQVSLFIAHHITSSVKLEARGTLGATL